MTLVELLVTLVIAALLAMTGLPAMRDLVADYRTTAVINALVGQVQYCRSAAVSLRRTVTLCPGAGARCGLRDSWQNGSFAFIDHNVNGRLDAGESILRRFPPATRTGLVTWRSFRNRKSLSIRASGLTDWQNGSFLYCPANGDERFAHQAIINAQARVRYARDRNGDGVREDASGRALRCES